MLKITEIVDDEKCYEEIRNLRWPNGIQCAHCNGSHVVKNGHDEIQIERQRYKCKDCHKRFDDLTNTIFANHRQPLKVWIVTLYFMGLNMSNRQIAKELDLAESSVQMMTSYLRQGVFDRRKRNRTGRQKF